MAQTIVTSGGRNSGKTDAMLRRIGLDLSRTPDRTAQVLFVPPSVMAKGEGWIREAYMIGPGVRIIESRPLPTR